MGTTPTFLFEVLDTLNFEHRVLNCAQLLCQFGLRIVSCVLQGSFISGFPHGLDSGIVPCTIATNRAYALLDGVLEYCSSKL